MARRTLEPRVGVAEVLELLEELDRRRQTCERLERSVTLLAQGELFEVGAQQQFVRQLRALADQAQESLHRQPKGSPDGVCACRAALDDPSWELVADVASELDELRTRQDAMVSAVRAKVNEWQSDLDTLSRLLQELNRDGAVLAVPQRKRLQFDSLLRGVTRILDGDRYGALLRDFESAKPKLADLPCTIDEVRKGADIARDRARHADLLLMGAKSEANLELSVLLRTPSQEGTHGVNLQGSSTVTTQDYGWLKHQMRSLLKAVDGARRARKAAPGGAGSTVAPQAPPATAPQLQPQAPTDQNGAQAAPGTPRVLGVKDEADVPAESRPPSEVLADVGAMLFRLMIPEQFEQYFADGRCSFTITTNELELPWELMRVGEDRVLCLERSVGRMPMGRALPRAMRRVTRPPRRRFLLVHADPDENLPESKREIRTLADHLANELKDEATVEVLEGKDSTATKLNYCLRKGAFDVLHYSGHAQFNAGNADLSGLYLGDRSIFYAQKIRRLLEGQPLVFLNACESGAVSDEAAPPTLGFHLASPAEGLASAFVYGGALGCIGTLWPVYDESAAEFATEFYRHALREERIGEALRLARVATKSKFPSDNTWAAFVLYGDPTFRLKSDYSA